MKILGIASSFSHDCSASLIVDAREKHVSIDKPAASEIHFFGLLKLKRLLR